MAVLPKNMSMVVQRLMNFNRQTIRVRSMSNDTAGAGQTIVFRFPSNTIIDLHNLQLKATLNSTFQCKVAKAALRPAAGAGEAGTPALPGGADGSFTTIWGELGMPRYSQALFERVDVTVGGTTISGSNVDYGGIYTILRDALCSSVTKKPFGEMTNTDGEDEARQFNLLHLFMNNNGDPINPGQGYTRTVANAVDSKYQATAGGNPVPCSSYGSTYTSTSAADIDFDGCTFGYQAQTPSGLWKKEPVVFQGFLGFLGGKFVRFVDTSITGPIEIRIRLAPVAVTWGPQSLVVGGADLKQGMVDERLKERLANYYLSDLYMIMDTISFTDDFYRQLLARRLIEGGSIVIPFDNYFSINKFVDSNGDTVSFNVATQSLDYLIGTLRRSDYNTSPNFVGLCEVELAGTKYGHDTAFKNMKPYKSAGFNPNYYNFISGSQNNDQGKAQYQWLVANQLIPTWPADVNDVWLLNQAAMDIANQISDVGNAASHYEFRRGKFAHITCLCHHAETEKFITGLDTRGASSNMQWMVSGLDSFQDWRRWTGYAPDAALPAGQLRYNATVWACCTSTIEISAGQNITVIF